MVLPVVIGPVNGILVENGSLLQAMYNVLASSPVTQPQLCYNVAKRVCTTIHYIHSYDLQLVSSRGANIVCEACVETCGNNEQG